MIDYIDDWGHLSDLNTPKHREISDILKHSLNYSWRRAGKRAPSSLRSGLDKSRIVFKEFIQKLIKADFIVVYIDECTFNAYNLPIYTWMPKGEPPENVIRSTTQRCNWIAAQWLNEVYFYLKEDTSDEAHFALFLDKLNAELMTRLNKTQYQKRTIFVMDNATIHKTPLIQGKIKELKMVTFTIPPYSPELNKIEITFGIIKNKLSKCNLNSKDFKMLVIKHIEEFEA